MATGQAFLLLETAASLFMAGVLWTMQLLNYPLLALVGTGAFARYEAAHNRRFALVVVPGVLAAAVGGIGLAVSRPGHVPLWAPVCELGWLAIVVISTVALRPCRVRPPATRNLISGTGPAGGRHHRKGYEPDDRR